MSVGWGCRKALSRMDLSVPLAAGCQVGWFLLAEGGLMAAPHGHQVMGILCAAGLDPVRGGISGGGNRSLRCWGPSPGR